jgi:hypothetical protein
MSMPEANRAGEISPGEVSPNRLHDQNMSDGEITRILCNGDGHEIVNQGREGVVADTRSLYRF